MKFNYNSNFLDHYKSNTFIFLLLNLAIFLMPHITFPGNYNGYAIKPCDIIFIFITCIYIFWWLKVGNYRIKKNNLIYILIILYFLFSVIFGYINLSLQDKEIIEINQHHIYYLDRSIKKLVAIFLCLFIFNFILVTVNKYSLYKLIYSWLIGCVFSVIILIWMRISNFDPVLVRGGVHLEGNFASSYYLISIMLSINLWKFNKNMTIFGFVSALIGLFISQSTIGYMLFMLMIILYLISLRIKFIYKTMCLILFTLFLIMLFNEYNLDFITQKLFPTENTSTYSFSYFDRVSAINSAYDMFRSSPLIGQGLQAYGFLINEYMDDFLASFYTFNALRIVNNVYLELLAETGIIGFLLYIYILVKLLLSSVSKYSLQSYSFLCSILILIAWLAFPSYTITYQWVGLALCIKIDEVNKNDIPKS